MKKKVVSTIVDGLLGAIVLFLAYCQVSMMVSMNRPENHGVPSVFGRSVLYVVTDSMATDKAENRSQEVIEEEERVTKTYTYTDANGIEQTANRYQIGHIEAGEGAVIKKEDPSLIRVGDIITFYYSSLNALDTHRVMEIDLPSSANQNQYVFHTRGDNLHSQFGQWDPSYRDGAIYASEVVGTVVSHSKALGNVLKLVSPAVPNGYAVWFVPLMVFIPLGSIATFTVIDTLKKAKKEEKEEEEEIKAAMEKAGVDPLDEAQRIKFIEKESYKIELRKQKEKAKQEELKKLRKQAKKGKKIQRPSKEDEIALAKQRALEEEKERIRQEVRKQLEEERKKQEETK